jgi:hypothetical protein
VPVFPPAFWDAVDALEDQGMDYPEYYITPEYEGIIDEVLCWGRLMACNPGMQLVISVVFFPAEYGDEAADPQEERSELIMVLAWRFLGFFADSAGDVCMALQLLLAPEHDTVSGVYFLYAADFISDPADFDPVVRPGNEHGTQWQFSAAGCVVVQPADFYGMDQNWTWTQNMPPMPMPRL